MVICIAAYASSFRVIKKSYLTGAGGQLLGACPPLGKPHRVSETRQEAMIGQNGRAIMSLE